ncbi:ABC transporter ATP-binding protein [Polaromonas sp. C04]|uniref:ABC transporter ATP-binding protein n=1 Tax=Polaromonas sp. C04 TaxID=1945857 RepID=UPI0009845996|nr:ABC transporter ATP-binding protein [Polaromonas sp. C04]OOG51197.1 ABC transporter ATP-binding protein [Polaromonas sp. C04]
MTLDLLNVSAYYGMSQILHGVSVSVQPGKVTCLLGLNGMGKTTTLRSIMGLVDRIEGEIRLGGSALSGPTHKRGRQGVTLVPEDRKVFAGLTVRENLEVAVSCRSMAENQEPITIDQMVRQFPKLGERMTQKAGTLSGGEQQMLVVARAMVANPKFILLDEPTEGLAPSYVEAIRASILDARKQGIGILLVEQSLPLALSVGDTFHVMENGSIVLSMQGDEARSNVQKIQALLTIGVD